MNASALRTTHVGTVLSTLLLCLFSTGSQAGQDRTTMRVSIEIVAPHQPLLAQNLSLPTLGELINEDTLGRHYYFEGRLQHAQAYYLAHMQRLGYTLESEGKPDAVSHEMRWTREGEIVFVRMRAGGGIAPTRISLRVTDQGAPNAPG